MTNDPKIAVLAFADTFGVVTSLLVRDEATFEQSVVRAADNWHYPPPPGLTLPPGSHHSAVVKHDFVYVLPPQFDATGEVTNAPVIDAGQIPQFAARIQHKFFSNRPNNPLSANAPNAITPLSTASSPFSLRVAARQKPRYFDRDKEPKRSTPPRTLNGPKKKK